MEKFFDITCRIGGLRPSAVVLVATVRALKHHGGRHRRRCGRDRGRAPRTSPATSGSFRRFGLNAVVGVNKFPTDTTEELELVQRLAVEHGAYAAELNTAFENGGKGATELAEAVVAAADEPNDFQFAYEDDAPIEEKIRAIATTVYGADDVFLLKTAKEKAARFERAGLGKLPICMAKTHLSLSHDAVAPERADRLHRDRARPPSLHRRRLDRRPLRRHADDARARQGARLRSRSTSTRTGAPSASSERRVPGTGGTPSTSAVYPRR